MRKPSLDFREYKLPHPTDKSRYYPYQHKNPDFLIRLQLRPPFEILSVMFLIRESFSYHKLIIPCHEALENPSVLWYHFNMARRAQLYEPDLPKEERVFYYESETDDPIKTEGQERGEPRLLPEDYQYIPKNPLVKLYSALLYRGFKLFARHYANSYLELTIIGRDKFKKIKGGYVLYGNHTNSYHDAFSPALVANRRIFTIINPVALDIPGIGKHLPYIGAMPLGTSPSLKKRFHDSIDKRLRQGNCLVIYPEAHLWPYYTGIRDFPAGDRSFTYPVRNNLPVFTMTTTYQKSHRKGQVRPRLTVYIDGPFYPDPAKSEEKNRADLAKKVQNAMKSHRDKNTYEYIKYIKKDTKK